MALRLEQLSGDVWALTNGTTTLAEVNATGNIIRVNSTLSLGATPFTATANELNALDGLAATVAVDLTASTAANEMVITITAKDNTGTTVAGVHQLEFWMSEDATGIGLTGDTYSGDLVASTGAIHSAHTAKKHWSVVTAATGIFVGVLTASAKPADQYVAVKNPLGAGVFVSTASGANWGA